MTYDAMQRSAKDALIRMVDSAPGWEYFATLTFASNVSEETAKKALHSWLRTIARHIASRHVPYFAVMDRQPDSGRLHFHVLFGFAGAEPRTDLVLRAWRDNRQFPTGTAEMQHYDGARNAIVYMVEGHAGDWDLNLACPRTGRCARRRCAAAKTGW